MRSFTPLGLLDPLCQSHWLPGSCQTFQVLSLLTALQRLCLNTFPPDSHMSLSLHPALWVSAQISPFQRDCHPGKANSCTITLCPFTLLYFSPLRYLQLLLPSPCARTGYTGAETLFYSLLFPQPRHLTRTTQAFCIPVAVQSPSSPGNVSVGGLVLSVLLLAWQKQGLGSARPLLCKPAQASSLTTAKTLERGAVNAFGPSPNTLELAGSRKPDPGLAGAWQGLGRGSVPRGKSLPTSLPQTTTNCSSNSQVP